LLNVARKSIMQRFAQCRPLPLLPPLGARVFPFRRLARVILASLAGLIYRNVGESPE
jgi:hypothetical protein